MFNGYIEYTNILSSQVDCRRPITIISIGNLNIGESWKYRVKKHISFFFQRFYLYMKCCSMTSLTWLLWTFSLVVASDLLGHTRRWRQIHVRSTSLDLFLSFPMPQNHAKFLINHLNFYCTKQIDYIFSMSVYCNRSQKTLQHVKNNSHVTRLRLGSYLISWSRSYLWGMPGSKGNWPWVRGWLIAFHCRWILVNLAVAD